MSPESPGNLVALDLTLVGSKLECQVDRYDPMPTPATTWLYVSWNAIECPKDYTPVGDGVAYVWVPPGYSHRKYRARVDRAGEGFEWVDRVFGLGLMLIVTLPKNYTYVFPRKEEPGPRPIRFKSTVKDKIALYWWLKGEPADAQVVWDMQHAPAMDIEVQCKMLNEAARQVKPSGAYPVHIDRPPSEAVTAYAQPPIVTEPPSWHFGRAIFLGGITMNYGTHITSNITNSPGAITNVAQYLANVTNTVTQQLNDSTASGEVKSLMKQLADQLMAIDPSINPEKVKGMGDDLQTLSNEMAKSEPRRKWYEISLEGIREAALAIGEIGKPIIETVAKLVPILVP